MEKIDQMVFGFVHFFKFIRKNNNCYRTTIFCDGLIFYKRQKLIVDDPTNMSPFGLVA